ncbi:MAG: c-type cytochrome [Candidatus Thiodiazotropha endolucinida]|nr:c-type cytochrome [Candidatus Thiodiazotropha taylori]MCW4269293.1 c-type cytochrome [Candidatus Thiodiazotropha endolucinida]MCG7953866.1 c-type cytochrome [Candidatus Thiodiazotropha taylori]MCG8104794.1 c-type cytochrome [Candidatus Thiodiazotropha taylori]MCG8121569.1 c-type cytochrome [Candidatus Thiodiazotropha taylori]
MKIKAVSLSVLIALAGLTSQLMAEERADVLERIAPIGKVSVTGEAKPAAAPATQSAAAEAPAAEAPATEAPAAEAAPTAEAASAAGGDALALATQSGCMACHQVATKVVGPAYTEVAAKYKGDAGALDMLVDKVKSGGVGTWGQVPMPPNAHISDDNIRTIVSWVLTH